MRHEVQGSGESPGWSARPVPETSGAVAMCGRLCTICAGVLNLGSVEPSDRFLHLGGHSLSAMVLSWRLRREFGVVLAIEEILTSPSLAALAALVEQRLVSAVPAAAVVHDPAPGAPTAQPLPLLPCQTGLWFLTQLDAASDSYNVPLLIRFRGALDAGSLKAAFQRVVARHDAFRLSFSSHDGEPHQLLHPAEHSPLEIADVDLSHLDAAAREHALERHTADEVRTPFNLREPPLLRASLIRFGDQDHALHVVVHHIICDEWSMDLLVRELAHAHRARTFDHPAPSYARYAATHSPDRERFTGDMEWWKDRWREPPPPLDLPVDQPRGEVTPSDVRHVAFTLDPDVAAALVNLGRGGGLTPFATFLAAFYAFLRRICAQRDIVIGAPRSTRDAPSTEAMFGYLVQLVPLRFRIDDDPNFLDLLNATRAAVADGLSHASVPLRSLVQELHPDRVNTRNPMVPVVFQYAEPGDYDHLFYPLSARVEIGAGRTARFDLHCSISRTPDSFHGFMEFPAALFRPESAERLTRAFQTLLHSIAAEPREPISRLPITDHADLEHVVGTLNATTTPYPRHQTIHSLFSEIASANPDRTAVVENAVSITYSELDRSSNRLAHHLRRLGVSRGARVAIGVNRGIAFVTSVLAVLKTGAAYVPIDPAYPTARLGMMLEDVAPVAVIRTSPLPNLPNLPGIADICLTADAALVAASPDNPLDVPGDSTDPAYIIFTSGSTGRPKGVVVPHRAVIRLVRGQTYAPFGPDQTHALLAPTTFDASTFELWSPLLNAGRLLTCPDGVSDLASIRAMIDAGATVMWLTAALFDAVIDEAPEALAGLPCLLIGGEALSPPHVARALRLLPTTAIINGYGPTESTTFACTFPIPRTFRADARSAPIGRPLSNTTAYILDEHLRPVLHGVRGELFLGGDGLAIEYLNAPDLTRTKFVTLPFLPEHAARAYRTGDLARFLPDGSIEFLGRVDDQVKVRGFRIEPGEIAAALNAHPLVAAVVVVARPDLHGSSELVAYFTTRDSRPVAPHDLAAFLRDRLPAYMVPAHIVRLPRLPLTPSGKVDRAQLPAPVADPASARGVQDGPSTPESAREDPIQHRLLTIWRTVLQRGDITPSDNFFDLGGHSLLAIKMFAIIERELGAHLPVSTIFRSPTISRLAADVARSGPTRGTDDPCVVPLRSTGRRPPIFLLAGIGGQVIALKPLIDRFATDRVCIGLEPPGMDADVNALDSVNAIAEALLLRIRAEQPTGPYRLCGYSFGGVVAYEIACLLRAANERVASLLLIDSYPPRSFFPKPPIERAAIHLNRLLRSPGAEFTAHARHLSEHLSRRNPPRRVGAEPEAHSSISSAAAQRVSRLCRTAYDRYIPRECDLFAHVFVRTETPPWQEFMTGPAEKHWAKLIRAGSAYHVVSGSHVSLMQEAHVANLAEAMNRCLEWDELAARAHQDRPNA